MTTANPMRRPPYTVGDACQFLALLTGGTCLLKGHVTAVTPHPTHPGEWRVAVIDDHGHNLAREFTVPASGHSDYLAAGHWDTCYDCGAPVDVQTGTGRWRGPRDEMVCRPACPTPVDGPAGPAEEVILVHVG